MAPVRNLRGMGNTKPIPVTHFIPPVFSPVWKIDVVTDTETIDITELLVEGSYLDGVTSSIGDFYFKILDPNNTYTDRIEVFDTLNVYLDYGKNATTLRFTGKIEKKSSQEQIYLTLSGRSIAMITTGTNVTYSSGGLKARSIIIKEIIDKYFSSIITTTGIEDDLTEIEVNYEEIPFWNVVEEICISGGRDAYISAIGIFNYFIKGSRENTTEAVVEDINLIDTLDYSIDTEEVYTKIKVYGQRIGNVPIIGSSVSNTTYTKGIIKELKIDNSSIVTESQASELASAVGTDKLIPPTIGSITSLLLPTILPGEKINISNPTNNIPPAAYQINSFSQIFSNTESPKTELIIQKQKVDLSTILKSNIKFQSEYTDNINPLEMDYSLIFDYKFNINNSISIGPQRFGNGTHNNTELTVNNSTGIGSLGLVLGETTGTWTSNSITLDFVPSSLHLTANSTSENIIYSVSLDGGENFIELKVGNVFTNAINSIILRVNIREANTKIEKIGILYKE